MVRSMREDRELAEAEACPACTIVTIKGELRRCCRVHTAEENAKYHPMSGHGYTPEQGWTHPQLETEYADHFRRDEAKS